MVAVDVSKNDGIGDKPSSEPKLSGFVILLASMAIIGGFLFGYDTGIVSAAMLYVPENAGMRPMNSLWQEVIISFTPGMAGVGSLLSGPASDRFGRKKVIVLASIIFTIGALVCAVAPEKVTLLVGRILLGLAIGFASMIVPVYIGEASPANVRGRLVTGFQFMITFGQVVANIFAGGFSYIDPVNMGWRLMFGLAAVPAIIQFIGFLFLPESPRWLYEQGQEKHARQILQKVYNGDGKWVEYELAEIAAAHQQENVVRSSHGGELLIWRILATPHVRKALLVGCALQAFQQLAGINTIMYYTGTIVKSAGVRNNHTTIWITVGITSCLMLGTFVPLFAIDKLGRRFLLIISIVGVLISLTCMGGAFYMINRDSAITEAESMYNFTVTTGEEQAYHRCLRLSNCDHCVTDENCGFCAKSSLVTSMGYCLPVNSGKPEDKSTVGFCTFDQSEEAELNGTSYIWANNFCKTRYTALPIVMMVIYLFLFSVGFGPCPWVCNSEFYPIWARSTCVAIATFNNWFFNLLVSLTFLSLSQAATKYGAFFIYAGITAFVLLFVIFMLPETRGCSIEEVEQMFMGDEQRRKISEDFQKRRRSTFSSIDIGNEDL